MGKVGRWFGVGVLAVVVPLAGCPSNPSTIINGAQANSPVAFKASDFQPAENCAQCHPQIYLQWSGSMHAQAEKDPLIMLQNSMANAESKGAANQICMRCHAPIGFFSGENTTSDGASLSYVSQQGVTCTFCHRVSEVGGVSNNQTALNQDDNSVYGGLDDPVPSTHGELHSDLIKQGEFCAICHEVNTPARFPAERTYREWKNSPYAETGITCQACHMSAGLTNFKPTPGKIAITGPARSDVPLHLFAGATTEFPGMAGRSQDSLNMAKSLLKAACALGLDIPSTVVPGTNLNFDVAVTNVGAGHNVPSGVSEDREMWLETHVQDANGNDLYVSGLLDSNNYLDPNAVIFHRILGDNQGKATVRGIWQAQVTLLDTSIPPKSVRYGNYSVSIPSSAVGPLSVVTTLHFRAVNQGVMDFMFGPNVRTVPVFDMASQSATVNLSK